MCFLRLPVRKCPSQRILGSSKALGRLVGCGLGSEKEGEKKELSRGNVRCPHDHASDVKKRVVEESGLSGMSCWRGLGANNPEGEAGLQLSGIGQIEMEFRWSY
jgi:hypothetical protein